MPKINPSLQHDVSTEESISLAFSYLVACEAGDEELKATYADTFTRGAIIPGFLVATGALIMDSADQYMGGSDFIHVEEELKNHREAVRGELEGRSRLVRIWAIRWGSWVQAMALGGSVVLPHRERGLKRGELEGLEVHMVVAGRRCAAQHHRHTRLDVLKAFAASAYAGSYK